MQIRGSRRKHISTLAVKVNAIVSFNKHLDNPDIPRKEPKEITG